MKLLTYCVMCASVLMTSCSSGIHQTDDGVIIPVGENQKIRLQVVNDDIVRVSAVPANVDFSTRASLMCLPKESLNSKGSFAVKNTNDTTILSTKNLRVIVSQKNGEITFCDSIGNVILQENKGGGKYFEPISFEGDNGYSVRQIFESPDNEAFYGLGQHQSDEFNYKGKNEVLYQYNTKVSIPVIVSNKNYGILWDNNSLTRFGNPKDYDQLSLFKLYDKNGEEGALTAAYTNAHFPEGNVTRRESRIDYSDLDKIKEFPEKFNFGDAKITWEGEIEPNESGLFHFILYYAGYTKVFVDNKEVVAERWRTAWNPNSYKFQLPLETGKRYPIRIEWKPDGGVSYLSLKALSPVDEHEQGKLSFWSEMADMIDYYFIKGDNSDEVISGYRTLTGRSQIMPKWAMGFWQSRERYKTQREMLDALTEFRKRNIPIDNIVLDWSYWKENDWGSHEMDPDRFPSPKEMIDTIHQLNGHIMISVWPKFYMTTDHYKEFDEKGWMYRQATNDSVRDWIAQGYIGSFYDAYSEGARKLFWKQMSEHLYSLGMDAWWMDASEPDIVSNSSLEYRKKLSNPNALGSSTRTLNAYALVNAMAIYDGQRGEKPDNRVFLLTRSGFGGLQRYSTATWSGDIGTCWEDMKAQISAGLNFSISGVPYWTMDIGGFCVQRRYEKAKEGSEDMNEWREMNTRWHQFGAFCPLYRSHGQYPYREVYNIAPETHPAYKTIVWYDRLRYRMMPYIYTLASRTWFEDYTIMRPLVMDFNGDNKIYNISDQYMFGDAFMVCPVYQYKARNRKVYLPKQSTWFDFYTGKSYEGGQEIQANAPYEYMPLFVKAGTIVPFGPEITYTAEKQADPLTLYVYAGADASFTLYEDEGVNYNYEKGKYSKIPFSYNEKDGSLTIGNRKGEYDGMLKERTIRVVKISSDNAVPFDLNAEPLITVKYNGTSQTLKL